MDQNAPIQTPEPQPEDILREQVVKPAEEVIDVSPVDRLIEEVREPEKKKEEVVKAEPIDGKKKTTLAPVISILTGIFAHGLLFYSFFADMKVWVGALLGLVSALVAVISGARAKRERKGSPLGAIGRLLGWLYLLGALAIIILVILFFVGLFSGLGWLVSGLGL